MATRSIWSYFGLIFSLNTAIGTTPTAAQHLSPTVDPRNVGRAGTSTVSGDSGVAMLANPGAMVRRSQPRFILSTSVTDTDLSFDSEASPDSPTIINQANPTHGPVLAYHHGTKSGIWVFGVVATSGQHEVSLVTPSLGQPPEDVSRLFPHRYGGTKSRDTWRRFGVGGAVRVSESLGVGISGSLSQVEHLENRRIWAGFDGRDQALSPDRDLALSLRGNDSLALGASMGLLLAPPEIPFEFAASVEYRPGPTLRNGHAQLSKSSPAEFPKAVTDDSRAELRLVNSLIVHSGIRYLGDIGIVEIGADFFLLERPSRESWQIHGLTVVDETELTASLDAVPTLAPARSHFAVRAAYDYEIVLGLLWLTTGYAWTSPASQSQDTNPVSAPLGGHTLALGIEVLYEQISFTLGYAREIERAQTVPSSATEISVVNPFNAGTGPAGAGTYRKSRDQFGITLELSWP